MTHDGPHSDGGSALMYRQSILDHYKNPRNWGTTEPVDVHHAGENPLCGDHITVTLALDGARVRDARFEGQGCAISQAAADILLDEIKGRPLEEVLRMDQENVQTLLGIPLSPARVKCAVLGLVVVKDAIRITRGELQRTGPSRTE